MSEIDNAIREKLDMMAQSGADSKQLEDFLDRIRSIESSNGQDMNHEMIQSGIHAGQSAMGQYGLMPNTVKELAKRGSNPARGLASMDPEQMKAKLEANPEIDNELAQTLGKKVLDRQQDPDKAAYSWMHGHNLAPEEIDKRNYLDDNYVKKFQKLKSLIGK